MSSRYLKNVANFLTLFRFVLVITIPVVVAVYGKQSLGGLAGAMLLTAWITDWLDGPLARKSGLGGSKFWVSADALIDLLLSFSCLIALVVAEVFSPWYLLVIVGVLLFCFVDYLRVQGITVFSLVLTYIVFASKQNPTFFVAAIALLTLQLAFSYKRTVVLAKKFFGKQA